MKKLMAILLSAALVLALSACVDNTGGSDDVSSTTNGDDIGAVTGTESETSRNPTATSSDATSSAPSTAKLSRDEAIAKALEKAGVKKADAREIEAELDREHGGTYWEVEFESGNTGYSYDIDSTTGEVLKAEREID